MVEKTDSANKVQYDAQKNAVSAVTIFQTNRAEVKRKITLNLRNGQNDVEVVNLPTCVEESSIRVDGIGNATIFDVVYHPAPPLDLKTREETFKELESQMAVIQAELDIIDQQATIIADYSKTLTGKDTTADQLEAFIDVYGTRQAKLNVQRTSLNERLMAVQKEISEKSVSLNVDDQSVLLRGVRVTIVVLAEGEGEAELSLTYLVSQAWWNPQYDLRANIASDAKSESSVAVHYRASISQKTGEDWCGVELALSTASPLLGTDIPSLSPVWISENPVHKTSKRFSRGISLSSRPRVIAMAAPIDVEESDEGGVYTKQTARKTTAAVGGSYSSFVPGSAPPPDFFQVSDSTATEGAMSTTFTIPSLTTIPSDSERSQQTHKVSIAELNFTSGIELEWITVPKEIASVFLRCKVKNTTKYLLLPGQANVFLNGNFVAKSHIPHVSPQESFTCSLGVDPAIRVTYHPQTKKIRTSGGSVLASFSQKTRTTAFEQVISIKNTRLSSVHRLLLKDQIPVSSETDIKVIVLEPSELAPSGKASNAKHIIHTVAEGVKVHWIPRGDSDTPDEDLTMDSAHGLLEFIVQLEPSSTVDLKLSWEVTAPIGLKWG